MEQYFRYRLEGVGKGASGYQRKFDMNIKDGIRVFLGSGFFLGLGPFVPGSFGALTGLAWHAFAFRSGWQPLDIRIWCLTGAVIFSALHYILTPWAQKYWNDPDPKNFVLDEIVGYLCVPLFAIDFVYWWQLIAAFVVFRILDAIKLPGASVPQPAAIPSLTRRASSLV